MMTILDPPRFPDEVHIDIEYQMTASLYRTYWNLLTFIQNGERYTNVGHFLLDGLLPKFIAIFSSIFFALAVDVGTSIPYFWEHLLTLEETADTMI